MVTHGSSKLHPHLQQHAVKVTDAVGREGGEGLCAVAALHDEGLAAGRLGQLLLKRAALAGCTQRGQYGEAE